MEEIIVTPELLKQKVLVDYSTKTKYMVDNNITQDDINNMISLLNYCFLTRNEFFVNNFNHKMIRNVYSTYNNIKSNIINNECNELFRGVDEKNLKLIKYIMSNYVNNFNNIKPDIITEYIPKESIQNIVKTLDWLIQSHNV